MCRNFTHVDFLDLQKPTIDNHRLKAEEESREDVFFAVISDVHLDEPMVRQERKDRVS